MIVNFYGLTGLIMLILDLWAIISVINSSRDTGTKVLWVLIILVLPVLGFIAWLLAGPRSLNKL
jgi:succinate dehydrogenase/fumarate reductase cytochrome b subunit